MKAEIMNTNETVRDIAAAQLHNRDLPSMRHEPFFRGIFSELSSAFSRLHDSVRIFLEAYSGIDSDGESIRVKPELSVRELKGIEDKVVRDDFLHQLAAAARQEFLDTDPRYEEIEGAIKVFSERADSSSTYEMLLIGWRNGKAGGTTKPEWVGSISLCEWDEPKFTEYGPGWIADFVVRDDIRGQGYGSQLLAAVLDAARKRGLPQLMLYTESKDAMRLYRRNGFAFVETRRVPDNKNEGAFVECHIMKAVLA